MEKLKLMKSFVAIAYLNLELFSDFLREILVFLTLEPLFTCFSM